MLKDKSEIVGLMEQLSRSSASSKSSGRLSLPDGIAYAAIAIAIQASGAPSGRQQERLALDLAQKSGFANMLETPSLRTVRLCLMLAFYMLSAGRRDAVFMYTGIAARAAVALNLSADDLHKSQQGHERLSRSPEETQRLTDRSHTWQSLVSFDLIVSSLYGRPSATEHQLDSHSADDNIMPSAPEGYAMGACYELSILVSAIVQDLYSSRTIKVNTADAFLNSLREWLSRLPPDVTLPGAAPIQDHTAIAHVLGCLHVGAYYYHVVMLVTRPFMISHLVNKLAAHRTKPGEPSFNHRDGANIGEVTALAHACTNAAIYLAQSVSEVHSWGILLPRMPLIE
jgi:hypothetical protein